MNDLGTWQERILANKPKTTNADRIRTMTDEELAWLFTSGCEGRKCPRYAVFTMSEEESIEHCKECWLDWLKQEVE